MNEVNGCVKVVITKSAKRITARTRLLEFLSKNSFAVTKSVARKKMYAIAWGPKYCWRINRLATTKAAPMYAKGGESLIRKISSDRTAYIETVISGKSLRMASLESPVSLVKLLEKYRNSGQYL